MSSALLQRVLLIVDDDPFIRSTLRQMLCVIGFLPDNIHEADNAADALLETIRRRPSLVLCDLHLADSSGFAFLAQVRKAPDPHIAATPVIVLTGDASQEAVLTARALAVDGYLVKPVSTGTLRHALDRVFERDPKSAPPLSERWSAGTKP